jgi:serine/threonine-protein kinase
VVERIVGSAYRIGPLLGRGGMGDVYAALGPAGERVALKFLRSSGKGEPDPEWVARFRREARIAARIASPHVARVLGAGKDRDGSLWIAFEYLAGEPMDERLGRLHVLPREEVGWIIEHVLKGLAAAHAAGVIHRDIKPGNIFVDPSVPLAKILDFGVSKSRDLSAETENPGLTVTGEPLGTPGFMAPEQLDGAATVDARADLYSVGLVAFVALAGRAPFHGRTTSSMLHHQRYLDPLTLAQVTTTRWPKPLERYLARALAREPKRRFTDAREALAEWRRVNPVSS